MEFMKLCPMKRRIMYQSDCSYNYLLNLGIINSLKSLPTLVCSLPTCLQLLSVIFHFSLLSSTSLCCLQLLSVIFHFSLSSSTSLCCLPLLSAVSHFSLLSLHFSLLSPHLSLFDREATFSSIIWKKWELYRVSKQWKEFSIILYELSENVHVYQYNYGIICLIQCIQMTNIQVYKKNGSCTYVLIMFLLLWH